MRRITNSPMKYIQGKDELANLSESVSILGKAGAYAVVDGYILDHYEKKIKKSFSKDTIPLYTVRFSGECSQKEIDRVTRLATQADCDVIVGIGGGKTLDTAKAAAFHMGLPVIIAPTSASTDAPCSALSVLYNDRGEFEDYLLESRSPDIVLVDTTIITEAPTRLLIAGMGDALATYYETRACMTSRSKTTAGGVCSSAAMALASACRDNLFADGYKAMLASETKTINTALENIIETNTYLSGVGFESGGLAAAHAIHDALTILPEVHNVLHGEKVAFGTLVQLVLEDAPDNEIFTVIDFCRTIGLPTCLAMLGAKNVSKERLMRVAEASCEDNKTMKNMPFPVKPDDVLSAIMVADKIGN